MPIDITIPPAGPNGTTAFGPGITVSLHTEVLGPFPSGSHFVVGFFASSDTENPYLSYQVQTQTSDATLMILGDEGNQLVSAPARQFYEGETVELVTTFVQGSNGAVLDQGGAFAQWSTTSGLGQQIQQKRSGQGGGLTSEQSTQLLETWQSTAQVISVDSTIPTSAGTAPPGGFVSAQLPVPCFGIIVRITQIPPDLVLGTPDANYSMQSLAVASFFRGSDLWMRVPVHTSNKMIPLFGDVITAAVATAIAATWLLNMSYQVAFRVGVAGEVIEMRFP